MSCDLLDTEIQGNHYQGDVFDIINDDWDLMIAHPPCTHLAVSGARWFKDKQVEQAEALEFVQALMDAKIPKKAIENPISIISRSDKETRPDNSTLDVWTRGNKINLSLARRVATISANKCGCWERGCCA